MTQLTPAQQEVLSKLTAALRQAEGVVAVVLGGSHAAGQASAASDLDVGIYYRETVPLNIDAIRQCVQAVSLTPDAGVTGLYEWGPWVNGGAWIQTVAGKVDILYRNLDQVGAVITAAQQGNWDHSFDQQPPYGFRSVIYLAEIQVCRPLFDPEGQLETLKSRIVPYPPALKERVVQDCLWLSEFTLAQCRQFAEKADVYNAAGCYTRVASYLVHALFALNEVYPLGDKRAMTDVERLPLRPENFSGTLQTILACPGAAASELLLTHARLQNLWAGVVSLVSGYQPRFSMS